jgi:hypothetical protein
LGQRQWYRLVRVLELRRHTRGRESEARSRSGSEPYGAEFSGVLVHPRTRPAEDPSDLDRVDERLYPLGHQGSQPDGEAIHQPVGELVEHGVVGIGGLRSAAPRLGAKWGWRLRCQARPYVTWQRRSMNGLFDRTTDISLG